MTWELKWQELKNDSYKKIGLYVIIIVSIVCLITYSISPGKEYVNNIIREMVEANQKTIQKNYEENIKQKNKEIKELQDQIDQSAAAQADLQTRINKVEKEMYGKKLPKTPTELRDRFTALGFKPTR